MSGTVYLVGAGPGAPDLLTLRAARLLGEADIVFHDALIHPDTLALACRAEKIAVGKRSGRHSTAQHFINKRLADAARRYNVVVRLKGGDPMLFGRAAEEIDFLKRNNIKVEVVPGVTAALAASAELGVSLTRRLVARSVAFATPRTAKDAEPSGWEKAVAAADTAVLYMAAGEAESVKAALIAAGKPATTPIALAENISLPGARCLSGVLGNLPEIAQRLGEGPALVLIGDVFDSARLDSRIITTLTPNSEREPERVEEKQGEPAERPLGDRQPEEGPVHHRAFAGAGDERLQRAREREVLQHEVEVGAALRHAIGRKVLQPDLARGDGEAAGGEERGEAAVNGASAPVQGGEEKHAADGIEEATLDEAERARIEAARAVLQVVAEAEERGAGEHRKEGGGAPAHGLIVPTASPNHGAFSITSSPSSRNERVSPEGSVIGFLPACVSSIIEP